jgi:spore maturation protein CgeB
MTTRLLYFGPQWAGSTSLQRLHAFQELEGVTATGVDNGAEIKRRTSLWHLPSLWPRIRWRLRIPVDVNDENNRLIGAVDSLKPDIVVVDNSKVISRRTLKKLRAQGVAKLVYYSPDDLVARHNLSLPVRWSLPDWDIVCTTKTFNIAELAELGVRSPFLIGKAFDPALHRPLRVDQVGSDYEKFDAVFVGTYEPERCHSINFLAESGVSVVVYGSDKGNWNRGQLRTGIELRESVFDEEYVRAWHTGKVALCFLRKINRDNITQRTMEIAAIGRAMVAERTDEHDQHFIQGSEYLGFMDNDELVRSVRSLLTDDERRLAIAKAGRERCIKSGYSAKARAAVMLAEFLK